MFILNSANKENVDYCYIYIILPRELFKYICTLAIKKKVGAGFSWLVKEEKMIFET